MRRIFKFTGKLGLSQEAISKTFRLILRSGKTDFDVDSRAYANKDSKEPGAFNLKAYARSKRRMLEIEAQKAMVTSISRDRYWKAGGPL